MNQGKKTHIGMIVAGTLLLIAVVTPTYIVSFEPEFEYGITMANLANTELKNGNLDEANKWIEQSLKVYPQNKVARSLQRQITRKINETN